MQREGVELSDAEAAARLDLSVKQVAELRRVRERTLNLEGFIGPDGEPVGEAHRAELSGCDDEDDYLERAELHAALDRLTAQERQVIQLHYEHDLTFEQIAERCGFTRQRASQIHQRALASMRKQMAA